MPEDDPGHYEGVPHNELLGTIFRAASSQASSAALHSCSALEVASTSRSLLCANSASVKRRSTVRHRDLDSSERRSCTRGSLLTLGQDCGHIPEKPRKSILAEEFKHHKGFHHLATLTTQHDNQHCPSAAVTPEHVHQEESGEEENEADMPIVELTESQHLEGERLAAATAYDKELELLRVQLAASTMQRKELQSQLEEAWANERIEEAAMILRQDKRQRVIANLITKMQCWIRGALQRKKMQEAGKAQAEWTSNWAAWLPHKLRQNLDDMQHTMHTLEFSEEDRTVAAIRLQAFWRGIFGRRVANVMRISASLLDVYGFMVKSATDLQRTFRGLTVRKGSCRSLRQAAQAEQLLQVEEMRFALGCIIRFQRAVRSKLAKWAKARMLKEAKKSLIGAESLFPTIPETAAAAVTEKTESVQPAWVGRALHDLAEDGLIAFYMEDSQRMAAPLWHQIGGNTATTMQRQIHSCSVGLDASDFSAMGGVAMKSQEDSMAGKARHVYLEGLSPGFLKSVDPDVWPRDPWLSAVGPPSKPRPPGESCCKNAGAVSPRRHRCIHASAGAPSFTEQRAQYRKVIRQLEVETEAARAGLLAHPLHSLFTNTPSPPSPSSGRPSPASLLRHPLMSGVRANAVCDEEDDEEVSWPTETRVFQRPRRLAPL